MPESSKNRIQELFIGALELAPEERNAWLSQQCQDADMLRHVHSLLKLDGRHFDPLEQGVGHGNIGGLESMVPDLRGLAGRCPKCRSRIKDLGEEAGDDVKCPTCGASFNKDTLSVAREVSTSRSKPSLQEFKDHLDSAGLLLVSDIDAFVESLPNKQRPSDGEQLARLLVKHGRLTAFQARQAYAGRGESLVLGNYVILEKLGQGGMGMVFKARHLRMDRTVAIKILSPRLTKTPELLTRFHREVKAVAKLEHPNIVTAYDADESRGTHFLVMQHVKGSDLASHIERHGSLSIDHAMRYVLQVAEGLEYAHRQGVVHRDIKPANLLLDSSGTVKILDMGLATVRGESDKPITKLTQTGTIMGTADYMAPEQALDPRHADARSDIYSLGGVLHDLIIGQPMYGGDTVIKKILAHRDRPIPSLVERRSEVPVTLNAVFQKMVAKQPEQRFQSMSEVIYALQGCLAMVQPSEELENLCGDSQRLVEGEPGVIQAATINAELAPDETIPSKLLVDTRTTNRARKRSAPNSKSERRTVLLKRSSAAVGVMATLLITLVALWASGILLRVDTDHGTLVIKVTGEDFATTVQGKTVTIRNTQTNDKYTVTLDEPNTTQPDLSPGDYEFLVATDSGLKTRTNRFQIDGKNDAVVEVWWEPVSRGDAENAGTTIANSDRWGRWPADAPAPAITPFDAQQAKQHQESWAHYLDVPVEFANSIGMKFRLVPPGEFMQGLTAQQVEELRTEAVTKELPQWYLDILVTAIPPRRVRISKPFYLSATEVTQTQLERVLGFNPSVHSATGARKSDVEGLQTADFPAETVTWNAAVDFCTRLSELENRRASYQGQFLVPDADGYRLPSESEWEFACRAGTLSRWWWGDTLSEFADHEWVASNSGGRPHQVATAKPNPFGLFDMHGNCWEWVHDWFQPFSEQPRTVINFDPFGPQHGEYRVSKGGAFQVPMEIGDAAYRGLSLPDRTEGELAFRVLLPISSQRSVAPANSE